MSSNSLLSNEKIERMAEIAYLYYIDELTQNEIAKKYNISRPMVSKIIKEAKDHGMVEIKIHGNPENNKILLNHLNNAYHIKGGYIAPDGINDVVINKSISEGAISYIENLKGRKLGIGLGTAIGTAADMMEECDNIKSTYKSICSLVGNFSFSNKIYHGNNLVRTFSKYFDAEPSYLYSKAFAENIEELEQIKNTQSYENVSRMWKDLDVMLVNIGNYPSVPDFASGARYEDKLVKEKAVGRILAYYYDINGRIITSEHDFAVQVPLHQLAVCKNVVGICSANVNSKAIIGALRSGFLNHIILKESLLKEIL